MGSVTFVNKAKKKNNNKTIFHFFIRDFYQDMGNSAVKQHFETAQRTGVLKISQKRLKVMRNELKYVYNNEI